MTTVTVTKDGEVVREVKYDAMGTFCGVTAGTLYGIGMKRACSGFLSNTASTALGCVSGFAFGVGIYALVHLYKVIKEEEDDDSIG